MTLSTRARYALQLMVAIARSERAEQPVSLETVSRRTRLSRRYLEHLAARLRAGSLLRSVPGRNGGYVLARPAESIRLGEIVEASMGPVNIVHCVQAPETCMASEVCACRPIYQLINLRISEVLNEYRLADLADPRWLARAQKMTGVGRGRKRVAAAARSRSRSTGGCA
jgi:Rrf2 family iron-sulfur cluster assembly transcriptional regulator